MAEYIGYRYLMPYGRDIKGNPFYCMGLTGEELIRCRDCKKSTEGGHRCRRFYTEIYDLESGKLIGHISAKVDPNGFCAWAECDA